MSSNYKDPGWLKETYHLIATRKHKEAINLIFEDFDDLLLDERFEKCDQILYNLNLKETPAEVLLAILTVTLSAKDKLPSRLKLVSRIREIFEHQQQEGFEEVMSKLE